MKHKHSDQFFFALWTLLIMGAALTVCFFLAQFFDDNNPFTGPVLILAVAFISRLTEGYFWGVFASVIGVLGVNILFTYPYGEFDLSISGYPLTFAVMLLVSILISTLTTQIKKQEHLRCEAKNENMRANLLRSISHDLRTPLASILGASSTLLENRDLPQPEQDELLRQMNQDAAWLVRVTENLLSITRCSGEDVRLQKSDEVLEDIIGSAIVKFRKAQPMFSVTVSKPEKLVLVSVDATLIEQVLLNLFENVVAHAETATRIRVAVKTEDYRVLISVSDDGVGLPPAALEHLFDGYGGHSDNSAKSGRRSMGIGLSVCNTIIGVHGGAMWAKNKEEGGAEVGFWLPCEEDCCEQYAQG